MNKTGTVKRAIAQGTWETKDGKVMYRYEIEMTDGTVGEYSSSKHESTNEEGFPFSEGTNLEYIFEDGKYPKIKQIQKPRPTQSGGGFQRFSNDDAINYHVALKEAREIVAMDGWGGHTTLSDKMDYLSDMALSLAGRSKTNIEKLKKL